MTSLPTSHDTATDRFKYILSETGPDLLYDLDDDPSEQRTEVTIMAWPMSAPN